MTSSGCKNIKKFSRVHVVPPSEVLAMLLCLCVACLSLVHAAVPLQPSVANIRHEALVQELPLPKVASFYPKSASKLPPSLGVDLPQVAARPRTLLEHQHFLHKNGESLRVPTVGGVAGAGDLSTALLSPSQKSSTVTFYTGVPIDNVPSSAGNYKKKTTTPPSKNHGELFLNTFGKEPDVHHDLTDEHHDAVKYDQGSTTPDEKKDVAAKIVGIAPANKVDHASPSASGTVGKSFDSSLDNSVSSTRDIEDDENDLPQKMDVDVEQKGSPAVAKARPTIDSSSMSSTSTVMDATREEHDDDDDEQAHSTSMVFESEEQEQLPEAPPKSSIPQMQIKSPSLAPPAGRGVHQLQRDDSAEQAFLIGTKHGPTSKSSATAAHHDQPPVYATTEVRGRTTTSGELPLAASARHSPGATTEKLDYFNNATRTTAAVVPTTEGVQPHETTVAKMRKPPSGAVVVPHQAVIPQMQIGVHEREFLERFYNPNSLSPNKIKSALLIPRTATRTEMGQELSPHEDPQRAAAPGSSSEQLHPRTNAELIGKQVRFTLHALLHEANMLQVSVADVLGDQVVRKLFFQLARELTKLHFTTAHGYLTPENVIVSYVGGDEFETLDVQLRHVKPKTWDTFDDDQGEQDFSGGKADVAELLLPSFYNYLCPETVGWREQFRVRETSSSKNAGTLQMGQQIAKEQDAYALGVMLYELYRGRKLFVTPEQLVSGLADRSSDEQKQITAHSISLIYQQILELTPDKLRRLMLMRLDKKRSKSGGAVPTSPTSPYPPVASSQSLDPSVLLSESLHNENLEQMQNRSVGWTGGGGNGTINSQASAGSSSGDHWYTDLGSSTQVGTTTSSGRRAHKAIPKAAQDLIQQLLNPHRKSRGLKPSAVLQHPFLLRFETCGVSGDSGSNTARSTASNNGSGTNGNAQQSSSNKVVLGTGSFGRVCKAVFLERYPVAVKIVRRKFVPYVVAEKLVSAGVDQKGDPITDPRERKAMDRDLQLSKQEQGNYEKERYLLNLCRANEKDHLEQLQKEKMESKLLDDEWVIKVAEEITRSIQQSSGEGEDEVLSEHQRQHSNASTNTTAETVSGASAAGYSSDSDTELNSLEEAERLAEKNSEVLSAEEYREKSYTVSLHESFETYDSFFLLTAFVPESEEFEKYFRKHANAKQKDLQRFWLQNSGVDPASIQLMVAGGGNNQMTPQQQEMLFQQAMLAAAASGHAGGAVAAGVGGYPLSLGGPASSGAAPGAVASVTHPPSVFPLPLEAIRKYFAQMALALLRYQMTPEGKIREKNVLVHRDIKLENMLLSKKKDKVVLIDLGLGAVQPGKSGQVRGEVGTPYYVAPEVLSGAPYNAQCDVWSLGVVLFRLLCNRYPFPGSEAETVYRKIRKSNPEWPSKVEPFVPKDAKLLVEAMLTKNPKSRITLDQVLRSEFVVKLPKLLYMNLGIPYSISYYKKELLLMQQQAEKRRQYLAQLVQLKKEQEQRKVIQGALPKMQYDVERSASLVPAPLFGNFFPGQLPVVHDAHRLHTHLPATAGSVPRTFQPLAFQSDDARDHSRGSSSQLMTASAASGNIGDSFLERLQRHLHPALAAQTDFLAPRGSSMGSQQVSDEHMFSEEETERAQPKRISSKLEASNAKDRYAPSFYANSVSQGFIQI
ncbi:unnamed protein product [Amoebophrya sp. A120]|nr:unnamed protein product [Amoebophrya sp. A120]|eukprot:GSA120T00006388001.1